MVAVAGVIAISAQGRRGLKINEVMIVNDSTSVVDDFGQYSAWVELFNSTFGPLEISSVYLTNDPANPTLYPVPLGDVNTEIPTRQHGIFWADGQPNKGTFHTSFTFKPGEDNYIEPSPPITPRLSATVGERQVIWKSSVRRLR